MQLASLVSSLGLTAIPFTVFALTMAPDGGGATIATARWGDLEIAPPGTHGALSVYLLLGDAAAAKPRREVLTLDEALAKRVARVYETSDVNQLEVENLSRWDVFIQMGDVIKGGKQDRMFTTDLLVAPGSGRIAAPVNCVEQGRWSRRGNEEVAVFASAGAIAPARAMRLAASKPASAAENQTGVWGAVAGLQDRLEEIVVAPVRPAESPSSLQLTLESKPVNDAIAKMEAAFIARAQSEPRAVGYAYAVGSEIYGAEVYASHQLLAKLWPKLVNAMAVEAMAASGIDAEKAAPVSPAEAAKVLAAADAAPGQVVVTDAGSARVRRVDSERFVASETKDVDQVILHKMVLSKD